MGEYNDTDPAVINQHLIWSREAGIDFWVASWWGPGSREDLTLQDHIFDEAVLDNIRVGLFYETPGLTAEFSDYSEVSDHIRYMEEHYFNHPNYLRVDGKPVLFIYLTRVLSDRGELGSFISLIRRAASELELELYLVGDHAFGDPPSIAGDVNSLDALTNYDVYGSMAAFGYATQDGVDDYFVRQSNWKSFCGSINIEFIPSITPGFNDNGVRAGHDPVSRKLTSTDEFGSLFRAMIQGAKNQVDPNIGNMIMITSWNEWHEDTQIEPVELAAPTSADISSSGTDYTSGLEYEGYETRYLEILADEAKP